jgi:transcription-repair coupling factor (superfamily II helicase)
VPAEVNLDLPVDAHLPRGYVERDDVRMEAYRRLAAVTADAEVDDLEAEWTDRYGEPPPAAVALLAVARLRVAVLVRGIRGISVQKDVARFDGWELKKSQEIRLQRISARVKVLDGIVTVPFAAGAANQGIGVVETLLGLLTEIAPLDSAPVASPAS